MRDVELCFAVEAFLQWQL